MSYASDRSLYIHNVFAHSFLGAMSTMGFAAWANDTFCIFFLDKTKDEYKSIPLTLNYYKAKYTNMFFSLCVVGGGSLGYFFARRGKPILEKW